MKNNTDLLGKVSAGEFLRNYWQKKPLLIRQAFPLFEGLLKPEQLIKLACAENVPARLVSQHRGQWKLLREPLKKVNFSKLGASNWTVLVQGVNHILPEATALLKHFSFIPHARLDDLMVSYAAKGGGVGPHFDSYDVFLLQGSGHRRWQISAQRDRTLVEGVPLKILRHFQPEQEWVLTPGDMLYLPPHYAHNGIAEDDCMTYSIGFRAPTQQELAEQFLVYMQDKVCMDGMYADPALRTQKHPAEISDDMVNQVENIIRKIKWGKRDIADFIGCYLSEPKPHLYFDSPTTPLNRIRFTRSLQTHDIALALQSLMLCHDNTVFINGTAYEVEKNVYRALLSLADKRQLEAASSPPQEAIDILYQWYLSGYIVLV